MTEGLTSFSTPLQTRRLSTEVRRAIKTFGRPAIPFSKEVRCLESPGSSRPSDSIAIDPPELEFSTTGFWKQLPPGDVGTDESGQPIVGRTWVERMESWAKHQLEQFTVTHRGGAPKGANPGLVYVMRSGAHGLDLYKIGKTTLSSKDRAAELTRATGVPTRFEVLAHWEVGDVDSVEKKAHSQLRAYRVNSRREFFRAPLPLIISTIGKIVEESA